jgi:hypothetical protein
LIPSTPYSRAEPWKNVITDINRETKFRAAAQARAQIPVNSFSSPPQTVKKQYKVKLDRSNARLNLCVARKEDSVLDTLEIKSISLSTRSGCGHWK